MTVPYENSFTEGIVARNARSLRKLEGCCKALSPLIHKKNLKTIMNVMRLSIGSTIPRSPRYSSSNSTQDMKMFKSLFPLDKLAIPLKTRYIQLGLFNLYGDSK